MNAQSIFRYQPFVAVSGSVGGEVPVVDDVLSLYEQQIYLTTSLDENSIEFEFQTDRNNYSYMRQTYLSLVLKLLKHRGFDSYKNEAKKEHNEAEDKKADAVDDNEVPLITHVNNIMHSIFSKVEVYKNNQQIYNSNGLYAHKSYISNTFKGAISEYKEVLHCEGSDFEANPEDAMDNPLEDPFFSRRLKLFSRPDGFMLYGKLGVNFFTTSKLLYPNVKVTIRLIRARPNFYMISDNPNGSLGIVDCSLCNLRITLKDDHHKKPLDMLAYSPVENNYLETLAKTFIIPA